MFVFGLQAHEIHTLRGQNTSQLREYSTRHSALKRVRDALYGDLFCQQEPGLFRWIYHAQVDHA